MQINLPLEKMTASQKIDTMEMIWSSLCQEAESVASPPWHGKVLAERENAVKDEDFIDWELSKKRIFSQLDEN